MSEPVELDAFLSRCDLSCRIAMRVLLTGADAAGRISRDELLTGVQREYRRLREASGGTPPLDADQGEISPLLADSPLGYFDEHTVGRLVAEGIVELEPSPDADGDGDLPVGTWRAAKLTPPARQAWGELQRRGDGAWLLGAPEERSAPPAARPHLFGDEAPIRDEGPGDSNGMGPPPEPVAAETLPPMQSPAYDTAAAPTPDEAEEDFFGAEWNEAGAFKSPTALPDLDGRGEVASLEPEAPRPPASTLKARGLVKTYRKRRVVNEVDVYVSEGEIVGLLGPNGAGKTTTFYMMVGLIAPDKGKVYLNDEDLTSVPMYRRARRGIGYLAQEPSVFRKLTVEENILAILQMRGIRRREQRERLDRLLDELGIKHLRSTKAYALSGGERRRLEITRALVGEPKFMLLDEPFAGVDPIAVHDIQQIVADLRRRGIGVLISDHNVEQTLDIVDRAYIMYDGRVRVSGTVSELVWNDEVAEIYLGPTLTARMRQRYTHPE